LGRSPHKAGRRVVAEFPAASLPTETNPAGMERAEPSRPGRTGRTAFPQAHGIDRNPPVSVVRYLHTANVRVFPPFSCDEIVT
jgi:hypothetical protein